MPAYAFLWQLDEDIRLCDRMIENNKRRFITPARDSSRHSEVLMARYRGVIAGFPDESFFERHSPSASYYRLLFEEMKAKLELFRNMGGENIPQTFKLTEE